MAHDVIIVGGSFAGLSAALALTRARRRVLVVDSGRPRNRFASSSHGFLTQDGTAPGEILAAARRQLSAYPTAEIAMDEAVQVARDGEEFTVMLRSGRRETGRRLILATGMVDRLPEVVGLEERWGRTVFHCPYCHGYELDGGPIAVLAFGAVSMHHALMLPDWGPTTFFVNGTFEPSDADRKELQERNVTVIETAVEAVSDTEDGGIAMHLRDGGRPAFRGVFVASHLEFATPFATDLGCAVETGPVGDYVRTDDRKQTSVPGVYACGDMARASGNVPVAVAEGSMAGVAAHQSLIFKDH